MERLDATGLVDGDGQLRIEAVRRVIEPRLHLVPHSRQLLYRPPPGLGWPPGVDAASFDIADHVRAFPLAAPAGQAQLLAACEQLRRRRLDRSRPLRTTWTAAGVGDVDDRNRDPDQHDKDHLGGTDRGGA